LARRRPEAREHTNVVDGGGAFHGHDGDEPGAVAAVGVGCGFEDEDGGDAVSLACGVDELSWGERVHRFVSSSASQWDGTAKIGPRGLISPRGRKVMKAEPAPQGGIAGLTTMTTTG